MANNYVYKQYQIKTKEDTLLVLGALITAAIVNLEKFDEYTTEAMILSEQCQEDFIPGKEYDDIHDKSLFRQRELLAIMGDQAKDVFSYRTLRDWMLKHDVEGQKLIIRKLEKDVLEVLEEFHDIRNWTFHNVQSRFVAEKEVFEHEAKEMEKQFGIKSMVMPQLNPLIVYTHKKYKRDMLDSFISHNLKRHKQFKLILDEMKIDYQDIYDKLTLQQLVANLGLKNLVENCKSPVPIKIITIEETPGLEDIESSIASLSMAIQKRKYDGSDMSYNDYTSVLKTQIRK